jgi:hypothetical protein
MENSSFGGLTRAAALHSRLVCEAADLSFMIASKEIHEYSKRSKGWSKLLCIVLISGHNLQKDFQEHPSKYQMNALSRHSLSIADHSASIMRMSEL